MCVRMERPRMSRRAAMALDLLEHQGGALTCFHLSRSSVDDSPPSSSAGLLLRRMCDARATRKSVICVILSLNSSKSVKATGAGARIRECETTGARSGSALGLKAPATHAHARSSRMIMTASVCPGRMYRMLSLARETAVAPTESLRSSDATQRGYYHKPNIND